MEYFFVYALVNEGQIVRVGKGHCFSKSEPAVSAYLNRRYGHIVYDDFQLKWCASEPAALYLESNFINNFIEETGGYPMHNSRRGGGGRQRYVRCKSNLVSGARCRNNALERNYGYCGRHR